MASKICKTCGIDKDLSEYHKSSVGAQGRVAHCKECMNWMNRSPEDQQKELELRELRNNGLKRCPKCKTIKSINEFGLFPKKKDGHRVYCAECERKINLEYARSDKGRQVQAEYMLTPEYFGLLKKRYHKKMDTKPEFKTALYLRNQLYNGITGYNAVKEADFITMVGKTPIELNKYLESLFEEGMTWVNHNRKGWHIDHIIPMNAFDMSDPTQQRASCYYVNLRPMWGRPNIQKGSKYEQKDFDKYMEWFTKNVNYDKRSTFD